MPRSPRCLAAALVALAWTLATPSLASTARVQGVSFAERVEVAAAERLALCAAELLRYKRVFRGYVAALYLEDCDRRSEPLADVARRLELSYFWAIPGDRFGPVAEAVIEASLPPAELAPLRERLATLHAAYRDVEPGDRYALTYVPGRGTELSLNGSPLVTVPGADFARAYFGIWLGEQPVNRGLRDRLLTAPARVRTARAPGPETRE